MAETQLSYILAEIDRRLQRLDSSVGWYRRRHFIWQMSAAVLSAIVTVLAGLKVEVWGREDLILVISAASTVVSVWGAFFAPRDLWVLNAETYGKLQALQQRIEFTKLEPDFSTKEPAFAKEAFAAYSAIVTDFDEKWTAVRKKSS